MFNPQWDCLYQFFASQQSIECQFSALMFEQQMALLSPDEDAGPIPETSLGDINFALSENLQLCKDNLTELVDSDCCQYVIDALAFYCDEWVLTQKIKDIPISQTTLEHMSRETAELKLSACWSKLQTQFAHSNHGGETFFDTLELLLNTSNKHRFALEVHYFCLKMGFVGRYLEQQNRLNDYQQQCADTLNHQTKLRSPSSANLDTQHKSEPIIGGQHATSS